jgi:hypothetical protein
MPSEPPAHLAELASFPLLDALYGRRSRRFGLGMTIPDGPLAHTSAYEPEPLSEEERLLLILAAAGISGWNFGIPYTTSGERGAGCNYTNRLIGRTFASGAGVHSSELVVTDDRGTHVTQFRDLDATRLAEYEEVSDLDRLAELLSPHIVQIAEGRVEIPAAPPHLVSHNYWVCNRPGTTLFVPVVDATQHYLTLTAILAGEGYVLHDHRSDRPLGDPGPLLEQGLLDESMRLPVEYLEQLLLGSCVAEASFMVYNVTLLQQAMGLGGWLYSGIDAFTILGAFAAEGLPGCGFRFQTDPRWPVPNPVGLDGLLEALVPPYVQDMAEAAELFAARKFGPGGTFDPSRPGPFRDNTRVKAGVEHYSPELVAYVGSVAQDVLDTYGKFPGTAPTVWAGIYAQAHHADLDFYERVYDDGAVLDTHRRHFERWHGGREPARRPPTSLRGDAAGTPEEEPAGSGQRRPEEQLTGD